MAGWTDGQIHIIETRQIVRIENNSNCTGLTACAVFCFRKYLFMEVKQQDTNYIDNNNNKVYDIRITYIMYIGG